VVKISVIDTGQGIGKDVLPHVFTPFRQADGSLTRAHGGLGLGLSIVRQLVEMHGGTVRAHSEGEGKGSVFTVTFARTAAAETIVAQATAADNRRLDGIPVLLVPGDELTREGLALVLERHGAEVTRAGSVRDAFEALSQASPGVILCDISMPVEDGYTFIRKLRAQEGATSRHVPAGALTAHARVGD